jgi:hypothetical protein
MPARVLPWRPRARSIVKAESGLDIRFPAAGEYAGRARYLPREPSLLVPELEAAVGRVLELRFAGLCSSAGPWNGQSLYEPHPGQGISSGVRLPEQDLQFLA